MLVIGLTGSIGMGKTTVAGQLARLGAKVCNADAIVHRLMAKGGKAVEFIEKQFSGTVKNGAVDRKALGKIVFADKDRLRQLEQLLHPLVVAEENNFVRRQRLYGTKIIVLDIPLLFETDAQTRCDITIVASAPLFIQRQRVLRRPGMTEEKFHAILRAQMPDSEKKRRATYVVQTGLGKFASFRTVALLMKELHET